MRSRAAFLAAGLLALLTSRAWLVAHELGTIWTNVTFHRDGRYEAVLRVDREHLPPGFALDSVPGGARAYFDGRPVKPETVEWEAPPNASDAVLRLTGRIPGGARTFAWESEAKLGSYLLTLRTEGDPTPRRAWEEGGKRSEDFALAAAVVPPTRARVVHQYVALG